MTRRSKIARLRKEIRNDMNHKLEDGECAKEVADWLNGQEEVQEMLRFYFKGNPISEQNLSEWRQSGFLEWQRVQESWSWMSQLGDEASELKDRGFGAKISEWFGVLMSVELTSTARELIQQENDPEKRWERLCGVYKQVSKLRRDDYASTHARLRQEKWLQEVQARMQKGEKNVWDLCPEDFEEICRRSPHEDVLYTPPMPKRRRKKAKIKNKPEKSGLIQVNPVSEMPMKPTEIQVNPS
jgi:hypothetical protein